MKQAFRTDIPRSAAENMRIDADALQELNKNLEENTSAPLHTFITLRIMQWEHPSVTLGSNENISRSLNQEYIKTHNIETARRPTGGRAVYHHCNDDEITFSITAPRKSPFYQDNLSSVFQWLSSLLLKSLLPLIREEDRYLITTRKNAKQTEKTALHTSCFDSLSRYELSVQGQKFFGSAQKRTARALLIQSTILLHGNSESNKILNTQKKMKGLCDSFPYIKRESILTNLKKEFKKLKGEES